MNQGAKLLYLYSRALASLTVRGLPLNSLPSSSAIIFSASSSATSTNPNPLERLVSLSLIIRLLTT